MTNNNLSIMKKLVFISLLTVLGLTSCVTNYYQVYEVKSSNLVQKENSLVYENNDCKILYNLWSEKGSLQFIFENKTDKDLFLDMNQTFFIKNKAAYNYYNNRTYQTQSFASIDHGYSTGNIFWSNGNFWPSQYILKIGVNNKASIGLATGISTKESEYVCIPANSFKVFNYFNINPEFIITCDKDKDFPKKQYTLNTFNEQDSPLTFRNRISYSFDKNGSSLQQVENSFWLYSVKNYSYKDALEKVKVRRGCSSIIENEYYFKIGGPNQFYKTYRKKASL